MSWLLVGREIEWETIRSTLDERAGGLVLSGDPGVGKTRLLRAAIDEERKVGHTVEEIRATRAAAAIPFGAMAHLFPPERHLTETISLFRAAAQRLSAGREGRRVLLAVDDAHLLDDGSAAFVHHLQAHGLALVIATVRGEERTPDAITALWKDCLTRRIEVPTLSDAAIDELIDCALPGQVCGLARRKIRRLVAGNPLYLRELLLAGAECGFVYMQDNLWRYRDVPRVTRRLDELVVARLDACGVAGRAIVELIAHGEPLPLGLIEHEDGLREAESAELVDVVCEGRRRVVRLAQPIYGEIVRAGRGVIRSRAIHRSLAARLASTPLRRRDDLIRLGSWQLTAGTRADSALLVSAARHAFACCDLARAERLARGALDAGSQEAACLLAQLLCWQGRHQDSVVLLQGGPPEAVAMSPRERARWLATLASALYWGMGNRSDAAKILGTARAMAPDDPRTNAVQATFSLFGGHCQEAFDLARVVLDDDHAPVAARLWAHVVAVVAQGVLGRTGQGLRLADQGLLLAERHRDETVLSELCLRLARAHVMVLAGRLHDAGAEAEQGQQDAIEVGVRGLIAAWTGLRGTIAGLCGDLTAAVTSLREAVLLEEEQDPYGLLAVRLTSLAGALASARDSAGAEDYLRRADGMSKHIHPLLHPQVETDRARVAAGRGEVARAIDLALGAATIARSADLPIAEAFALHDAARHGAAARVSQRLAALAERVDSVLVAVFADSAAAQAGADGARLEAVARSFEELEALLLAAETTVAGARAYQMSGLPGRANAAMERTRALTAQCPGSSTPKLSAGTSSNLTPRERQITSLALSMTSREIAHRLNLSIRTVNNHLGRAYTKLGIHSRAELSEMGAAPWEGLG